MKILSFILLLIVSTLAQAGPETVRAIAVIDNAFGVNVSGANLRKIANAFLIARSDLIPEGQDPVTMTNDQKAAVLLSAVQIYLRGTVRGVAGHVATVGADAARDATIEAAKDSVDDVFE